jgi:hypothetical protein
MESLTLIQNMHYSRDECYQVVDTMFSKMLKVDIEELFTEQALSNMFKKMLHFDILGLNAEKIVVLKDVSSTNPTMDGFIKLLQTVPITYDDIRQYRSQVKKYVDKTKLNIGNGHFYENVSLADFNVFFKITRRDETHNQFLYKDGFNFDVKPFLPQGDCSGGGLYFADFKDIYYWAHVGVYIRPILVPKGIPYYMERNIGRPQCPNKFKAPIIFALPRILLASDPCVDFMLVYSQNHGQMVAKHAMKSNNAETLKKCVLSSIQCPKFKMMMRILSLEKKYDALSSILLKQDSLELNTLRTIYGAEAIPHQLTPRLWADVIYQNLVEKNPLIFEIMEKVTFPALLKEEHVPAPAQRVSLDIAAKRLMADLKKRLSPALLEKLRKFESVHISGSYVLQFLTDSHVKSNDIDIYISYNSAIDYTMETEMKTFLLDKENKKTYKIEMPCEDGTDEKTTVKGPYKRAGNQYGIEGIHHMVKLHLLEDTQVDLIYLYNHSDASQFIHDNFDFEFCMHSFNLITGSFHMHPLYDYRVGRISDTYITKAIGPRTDSFSRYRIVKTLERYIKYTRRGFTVTNIFEFLQKIQTHLKQTVSIYSQYQ